MIESKIEEIHLLMIWRRIWSWKWILIICSVVTGILSLIVSLILPDIYSAEVTILTPETAGGGGLTGGLIAAAAQGLGKGPELSSQTILALLNSYREKKAVIKKFDVIETFRLKQGEASKFLNKITDFSLDELEGLIRVKVETHSAELSAKMANFYVNNLDSLNEEAKITSQRPLVKVIDWARPPSKPSKPRVKWNTVIGGFLGFFISFFILYVKNILEEMKEL